MSFYRKIKYYLVHTLKHTNKQAQQLIDAGIIQLNGNIIFENCLLNNTDEIKINEKIVRAKKNHVYIKFYKPCGFESTLNEQVKNNLSHFFKAFTNLSIAGRLDKASEGLLILSDDGEWVENLCHPKFEKEKEYRVQLNKPITENFIQLFSSGVKIGNYITKPCRCERLDDAIIKVILTEGKNRQIRRMCWNLGYSVINLKRIRIANYELGKLSVGDFVKMNG